MSEENNTQDNQEIDFDIIEEGEEGDEGEELTQKDKAISDAEADDGDDSEGNNEAGDNRSDRPKLTSSEKRRIRKQRIKEKLDTKDSLIMSLQQKLRMQEDRLNAVERRGSSQDLAQLDEAISKTSEVMNRAMSIQADALVKGDTDSATVAMREILNAQRRLDQLNDIKTRSSSSAPAPRLDPLLVRNTNTWMEKNSWFKPEGKDIDSKVARAVDDSVSEDGFDPRTSEYWEELDRRLARHLPHRTKPKNIDEDIEDDVEYEDEPKENKKPKPVISGGGRTPAGGRQKVVLSKERVQALKDAGYWNDPGMRNKMIKSYLDYDRKNGRK